MRFNINEIVRVQLTEEGRRIHRQNHDAFMASIPRAAQERMTYTPPKEDADGWSEWQMWHLMQEFGVWMRMGLKEPFSLTIEIPEKSLKH